MNEYFQLFYYHVPQPHSLPQNGLTILQIGTVFPWPSIFVPRFFLSPFVMPISLRTNDTQAKGLVLEK